MRRKSKYYKPKDNVAETKHSDIIKMIKYGYLTDESTLRFILKLLMY
jgi:hypothetical protein